MELLIYDIYFDNKTLVDKTLVDFLWHLNHTTLGSDVYFGGDVYFGSDVYFGGEVYFGGDVTRVINTFEDHLEPNYQIFLPISRHRFVRASLLIGWNYMEVLIGSIKNVKITCFVQRHNRDAFSKWTNQSIGYTHFDQLIDQRVSSHF